MYTEKVGGVEVGKGRARRAVGEWAEGDRWAGKASQLCM